ncbi:hypothetical protein ACQY0O_005751 [Thecaphora frezii]
MSGFPTLDGPLCPNRPHQSHQRTTSLLSSFQSWRSLLVATSEDRSCPDDSPDTLCTDAELFIADPTSPTWADEAADRTRSVPASRSNDGVRPRFSPSPPTSDLSRTKPASSIMFPLSEPTDVPTSSTHSSADSIAEAALFDTQPSTPTPATSTWSSPVFPDPKIEARPVLRFSASKCKRSSVAGPTSTASLPQGQASREHYPKSAALAIPTGSYRASSLSGATDLPTRAISRKTALYDDCGDVGKPVIRAAGFRTRSIRSIRGIAAAWVPARFASSLSSSASSSRSSDSFPGSPSANPETSLAAPPTGAAQKPVSKKRDRPVKLNRKRLDKAVSLAVEAAQAAEEDERTWEAKQARKAQMLLQRRVQAAARASENMHADGLGLVTGGPSTHTAALTRETSREVGHYHDDIDALGISYGAEEADDDVESEEDLSFSLDLYISSLSYLISAISEREAAGLGEKQRNDMRQQLEEGMGKLGFDVRAELQKTEAMRRELDLEREKASLRERQGPLIVHHHYHTNVGPGVFSQGVFTRAHAAAKASGTTTSFAGKIGSSVLDIGLTLGAGAISALSSNLSAIAPRLTPAPAEEISPKITDLGTGEDLASSQASPSSESTGCRIGWARAGGQNSKQWELAVAFASSAANALASSLWSIVRAESERSDGDKASAPAFDGEDEAAALDAAKVEHVYKAEMSAEDRLILLSASLARALKRSPLPSQLYQLLGQIASLLAALDRRFSLTERGTQMAIRQTSLALRFIRKHDLHVKAVRVMWAAVEAAVAALEAYRDEEGWQETPVASAPSHKRVGHGASSEQATALLSLSTSE